MVIEFFGDDISGPIYEFGSLQVGQSDFGDMRYLFPGKEFVGCDLLEGPGVDLIMDATDIKLMDNSVGCVLMLEMLEMCRDPLAAVMEAHRILKRSGLFMASTIGPGWPIERFPPDYWRITPRAFEEVLLRKFRSGLVNWGL
jgi:SAM-dependent methyltransferase